VSNQIFDGIVYEFSRAAKAAAVILVSCSVLIAGVSGFLMGRVSVSPPLQCGVYLEEPHTHPFALGIEDEECADLFKTWVEWKPKGPEGGSDPPGDE